MIGWASKAKWAGKAHFVTPSGETACALAKGPYGMLMKTLFKTEWKPLDADDHLCRLCRKAQPRECTCGRCRVLSTVHKGDDKP